MSADAVVSLAGITKVYPVYRRPEHRLFQMFLRHHYRLYREYWAVKNISFNIKRGETIGLIGRNGAGKSTLLQIISGTLQPTSGTRHVRGRVAAMLELGAGFNPEFTGRENISLAATILGLTEREIRDRFQSIIEFASIGDFIDQPVKVYSSGMYARLAFAVSAHVDADILIVDEILSVGDAAFGQKCMRFIHQFRKRGSLILVSHDTGTITSMCDRAIWLEAGEVRQQGEAKEVCHDYITSINKEKDLTDSFKIGGSRKAPPKSQFVTDQRLDLLKNSNQRNDLEVFNFDPTAPWFGQRGATIQNVTLLDAEGDILPVLEGGEQVTLRIQVSCEQAIAKPIVGFFIKNNLGQYLFGDNTFLSHKTSRPCLAAGEQLFASFTFQMPFLPTGDYAVLASIAEGTQEQHQQHHWIDDALFFKVHSSHVAQGLIGVPMLKIDLAKG